MRTVWKHAFQLDTDRVAFALPEGARPVFMTKQDTQLAIWFEVETTNEKTLRQFAIVGTGHQVPSGGEYVGTIIDTPFVWHIYQL